MNWLAIMSARPAGGTSKGRSIETMPEGDAEDVVILARGARDLWHEAKRAPWTAAAERWVWCVVRGLWAEEALRRREMGT